MSRVLLHVCCGPCSTHVVEELSKEHDVTLFWSNSNIWPELEYVKRLKYAKKISEVYNVPLVLDDYDHKSWLKAIEGWENEPEGGVRCERCFQYNLTRVARYALREKFDAFTTTLTISPHKNAKIVFEIGQMLSREYKVSFLAQDFKKKGGFERSIMLSNKHELYRQNYCGCEFSLMNLKKGRG